MTTAQRGRPKGSKNKATIEKEELKQMQLKLEEYERQSNSLDETLQLFTEGFVTDMFNSGSIKTVSTNTLQKWFSNPDEHILEINELLTYFYIIDGDIFQLYDMIYSLSDLKYKIKPLKKEGNYKEDLKLIDQYLLKKVNHKQLTRDLITQLASHGTCIGTWVGGKVNPYFYTFDNLEYIYPYGRDKGKMTAVIDLKWLSKKKELERQIIFNNLKPIVTQSKYEAYDKATQNKEDLRYILLPTKKTLVARTHTLSRNQRLGLPHGLQSILEIQHKQTMKTLEKTVANKVIRAVALLKFKGKDDNDNKVKVSDKKKVYNQVKKALEKNTNDKGLTVIGIPDFASFESQDFKNSDKILSPEKYEGTDNDIAVSTGVSRMLNGGQTGSSDSAKINLKMIYKKIAILLENVEEIYNQLIMIILGKRGENYHFEYDKDSPLDKERKIQTLEKLQAQGYSTKYILDELGINAEEYFEESIYEIETLDLRNKIIPPLTSNVLSGKAGNTLLENLKDNTSTYDIGSGDSSTEGNLENTEAISDSGGEGDEE